MTAPDDVRARFEAWLLRLGYTSRPERRPSGKYVNGQIQGNWLAWQAAHADLSGEVRELVGVVRELADDLREWGATDFQLAMRAARLDAALAKFHPTHQEKP